jgi:hypothetical protein
MGTPDERLSIRSSIRRAGLKGHRRSPKKALSGGVSLNEALRDALDHMRAIVNTRAPIVE